MPDGFAVTGFDFVMVLAAGFETSVGGVVFFVAALCLIELRVDVLLAAVVASFF